MKTTLPHFRGFYCLKVLIILFIPNTVFAQDEAKAIPAEFKISIESSNKMIKLVCLEGCIWKELHYRTSSGNILQAVNRYGMADLTQREVLQGDDANDFLFTLETPENTIKLKGIQGTAWKDLSFGCFELQCLRVIDGYGVVRYVQ